MVNQSWLLRRGLRSAFLSGSFEDPKALFEHLLQDGGADRLPGLQSFHQVQQRAAHTAGAVRPVRIYGDPFQAGEQHLQELKCLGGVHGPISTVRRGPETI